MKKILFSLTIIALLGLFMTSCGGDKKAKTTETTTEVKKEEPTKAETAKAETVDVSKMTANLENGKKVYSKTCIACHFTGVSGAPALKEDKYKKEEWQSRADKGMAELFKNSITGFNNNLMPAKGTCVDCSDQDMFDAISYMYNEAKVVIKK
jgi:cytochrome c5